MKQRPKAFIEAIKCFSVDPVKSRSFLDDQRLSQAEKIILSCYFHLRSKEPELVLEKLSTLTKISEPVIEAHRLLLLGMANNSHSHFETAIKFIEESLCLMKGQDVVYFEFIALINLFILKLNMKDREGMENILKQLDMLPSSSDLEKLRVKQCHFYYQSFRENLKKAKTILMEIDAMKESIPEADLAGHLVCKFDFHIKTNEFEECKLVLEEIKKQRNFKITENFQYLKILLTHYLEHSPIYFNENDFKGCPLLLFELKVIHHFEEGHKDLALKSWENLKKLNQQIYGNNFQYRGGKTIFSLCLAKYIASEFNQTLQKKSSENIIQSLYSVLKTATTPIRKELLFEMCWGRPPESKEDLILLAKSVYRVKVKHKLNVKTRKGSYFLEPVRHKMTK